MTKSRKSKEGNRNNDYHAIVVGSGFGGSVAAIMMAKQGKNVLIIERGTWWKNPEGPSKPHKEITFDDDKVLRTKEFAQRFVFEGSAAKTLTLASVASQSDDYAIDVKNESASELTIAAKAGDVIDGGLSIVLAAGDTVLIERVVVSGTPVYRSRPGDELVVEAVGEVDESSLANGAVTQYWPRPNNRKGLIYVAHSLYSDGTSSGAIGNRTKDLSVPLLPSDKNRGLYRIRRFSDGSDKRIDVISANGVGGGSLFYSGVNLVPEDGVLDRLGLNLRATDFQKALRWMTTYRGRINKIVTKDPVPHRVGSSLSFVADGNLPTYERPDPNLRVDRRDEEDYLLTDRARVLKWALEDAVEDGDFHKIDGFDGVDPVWKPLPLSMVEYDENRDKKFVTRLTADVSSSERRLPVEATTAFPGVPFNISVDKEYMTVTHVDHGANELTVKRNVHGSVAKPHNSGKRVYLRLHSDSDSKGSYCQRQGRCMVGCMPSARHTLYKTIINVQREFDYPGSISVAAETEVLKIEEISGGFRVAVNSRLDDYQGPFTADKVFLGAGVLGSTEVLLKSKQEGLDLSANVGKRFSTNGDYFAFGLFKRTKKQDDERQDPSTYKPDKSQPRYGRPNPSDGAMNASGFPIAFDEDDGGKIHVHVEDCGIPAMFAELVKNIAENIDNGRGLTDVLKEAWLGIRWNREPFPDDWPNTDKMFDSYETEQALVQDVFLFHAMGAGPDEVLGEFKYSNRTGLTMTLPKDPRDSNVYRKIDEVCKTLANKMEVEYHLNPLWNDQVGERRVTVVHPLGGIPIGSAANANGQVLRDGGEPHDDLYVVDAAAIPGAVGVNPTLTIVALAIKSTDYALANW